MNVSPNETSGGTIFDDSLSSSSTGSSKFSVLTLISLLGLIYGLALVLAIVWILWLYMRRQQSTNSMKNLNSRDFNSSNTIG